MAYRYSSPHTAYYGVGLTIPHTYYTRYEARTDPVKRVKPLGVNALFNGTSVSSFKKTEVYGVAVNSFTIGTSTFTVGELIPPTYRPATDDINVGPDDWATAIRLKLKDQSVNLAQAFAERKQAAHMFVDFGSRILKAYKALRRSDPRSVYYYLSGGKTYPFQLKKKFSAAARDAGDHWLAWQYGIRPLISDLKGSVEEIYKVRSVQPLVRRVTTTVRKQSAVRHPTNPTVHTVTARVIAYAEFQSGASDFDQVAQRLGLTDPLLLAWELIPYSFVIDWFINVGDFIQATGSIAGLLRVGVSESKRYTVTATNTHPLYGGTASYNSVSKDRTFYGVLPGPSLKISGRPFGDLLAGNFDRVYSALALARQPLGTLYLKTLRK